MTFLVCADAFDTCRMIFNTPERNMLPDGAGVARRSILSASEFDWLGFMATFVEPETRYLRSILFSK